MNLYRYISLNRWICHLILSSKVRFTHPCWKRVNYPVFVSSPQFHSFLFLTTFPIYSDSTHLNSVFGSYYFSTVIWGRFSWTLIHFFSLMSHIVLVYNQVTLCDWRHYIVLLPSYSSIIYIFPSYSSNKFFTASR